MNFNSSFLKELQSRGFIAQITHPQELDKLMQDNKISAYIGFDCTASSLHVGSLIQIMILRLLQKHGHRPIVLLGGGTTKIGDPSGKDESRQILSEEKIKQNLHGIRKILAKFIDFGDKIGQNQAKNDNFAAKTHFDKNANINNGNLSENQQKTANFIQKNANFSQNNAILVNNDQWLNNLNYIEFLREIGRHFSINRMLGFDSVKMRLEREQPLSFLEFNYMILQAYDFYELNDKLGCALQIGGSDQWGNIVNGVELIRRIGAEANYNKDQANSSLIKSASGGIAYIGDFKNQNELEKYKQIQSKNKSKEAFGLTSPLLTTADGKKMGKTADGAIWLDAEMLSPYDYFQYFRNTHDADVVRFLKLFTDLPLYERDAQNHDQPCIAELENLKDQEINKAKEILAFEVSKICHGTEIANEVLQKAREIFISKSATAYELKEIALQEGKKLIEIIKEIGAVESNGEAKRLIEGKAVKINDELVLDANHMIKNTSEFNLAVGKKKFFKIKII